VHYGAQHSVVDNNKEKKKKKEKDRTKMFTHIHSNLIEWNFGIKTIYQQKKNLSKEKFT